MKVTIIGSGYVGLVTGACLAEVGNDVLCLDLDADKISLLNGGCIPIYEPGLEALIARNRAAGRLRFSTDVSQSVAHGEVQFIAVGTPPDEQGAADLQHVLAAARNIGKHMQGFKVIVNKSTVPVGSADQVYAALQKECAVRGLPLAQVSFSVVSNPEFLKEGAAIDDFMRPDRIVIGTDDDALGQKARALMCQLYAPFNRQHARTLCMDVRSAEFTKYAANAMLATRISFMNELANLADQVGVDIEQVRVGIGADPRIGYGFLYAGVGYGGSCFPKDVRALMHTAHAYQQPMRILHAVQEVNQVQQQVLVKKITQRLGVDLSGKVFAIWGLSFKPNTDDMREAPSRIVIAALLAQGATVRVYDPVAMTQARTALKADCEAHPEWWTRICFCASQTEALQSADALVILTEWKSFRSLDIEHIKTHLLCPLIFDGRNLFEPLALRAQGIEYYAMGRGNVPSTLAASLVPHT